MLKKLTRMIAAVSAAALVAGALPGSITASAARREAGRYEPTPGTPVYTEDFEASNIRDVILNGQNGFSIAGSNKYAVDTGNGFGTGSNAVRFCNIDWGGDNSLTLDLAESAQSKNAQDFPATVEGNALLGFKMVMDADFGGFWNGGTNTLIIQDQDGNGFMGLEAYTKDNGKDDITLNLIALNDAGNENIRYELAKGRNNVFKLAKDVQVYLDREQNAYQLRINGKIITAGSYGAWIPMSTSGTPGAASKATGGKLGKMKIDNVGSNWYGGIVLDEITVAPWTKLEFLGEAQAPDKAMSMWYRQPASKWAESLPLGNGRIGAMIWGGILSDTVSLNDVTAWSGQERWGVDKDNTGNDLLKQMQDELKKESPDQEKLAKLMKEWGGGDDYSNPTSGTHRPFGKLDFTFPATGAPVENYRRSLDLEDAVSTVEYISDGVAYTRTAFVSNPDQVMVMTYEANQNGKITFDTNFATESPNGGTGHTTAETDYLRWDGAVYNNSNVTKGVNTFAFLKALNDGGTVTYDENGLHVEGADKVTLILSLGTDFEAGIDFPKNSAENAKAQLDAAVTTVDNLYAAHTQDVAPRFNRMKVEIGDPGLLRSEDPTDIRLEKIRQGGDIDGSFMSLWYQYARYLMIAGSREDSPMPMNLQGIWNDNVAANMAWTCDYHLDINIQMNQWMANSSNLSEGEMPIFDFMEKILIPHGEETAQRQYGTKAGWVTTIMTNAFGATGNNGTVGGWHGNTTCGAWLAQEIMSYYAHTNDKEFLETRGYPMLKSTAEFYNEFMIQHTDKEGNTYWVTAPSSSPEHGQIEMMSTMEITVIGDIFDQVLKCYDILGMEHDEFYAQIQEKRNGLQPYKVMPTGNLAEWPYNPTDDGNTAHRHTSHLLGLFPYAQITPDKTPDLAQASLVSMQRRFDRSDFEHTEWTAVNAQGQYARLKDGDNAYKYLKLQGDTFTWPNLLSISPEGIALAPCDVYIIDGTFGVGQATAEMLLQSHSDRLEFLPALPKQWGEGNIEGMSAEGAFDVDFTWKDYTLSSATITSRAGNKVNILKNAAINWENVAVFDSANNQVATTGNEKLLSFDTTAGESYTLKKMNGEALQTGRIINNADSRIQYNGFNYHNDRPDLHDIGGDVHYSEHQNSTITFTFTGTGIDVLAEKDSNGRKVNVLIDGQSAGEYSSYSDTYEPQGVVCSVDGLEFGNHTIQITQVEDGGYFVFDAFAVRGQYFNQINDDNPMVKYESGWQRNEGRDNTHGNFMGDIHFADNNDGAGKSVTVDFYGTGIETIVEKDPMFGNMAVEVDGVSYGTAFTGDGKRRHTVMPISGLPKGNHTLKITNAGGGEWGWIAIDGFIILDDGDGVGINPGTYEMRSFSNNSLLEGSNGTIAQTTQLTGSENQKWYLDYVQDRSFRLINAQSGMAASLQGGAYSNLIQEPVDAASRKQLWQSLPVTLDNGQIEFMNCTIPQFVQINGVWTENDGTVALWDYSLNDHYRWTLEPAGDGFFFIKNGVGTYLYVDQNNPNGVGAQIKTWEKLAGSDQMWKIAAQSDGTYRIANPITGEEIINDNGSIKLAAASEEESGKWNAELKKQNGVAYYVFTSVVDDSVLNIGGESAWKLAPKKTSETAPTAQNIQVSGTVIPGETLSVTYDYKTSDKKAEGESVYNVYVLTSKFETPETPIATGSAAGGFEVTVPETIGKDSVLAIEILPKNVNGVGNGKFYAYVQAPATDNTTMSNQVKGTQDFSDPGVANAIRGEQNGWSIQKYDDNGVTKTKQEGVDFNMTIAEKDGIDNALGMRAVDWWKDTYFMYNLDQAGIGAVTGKAYVEFDAMFDAPNYFDKESRMFVALNNGDTDFAAVKLTGRRLDVIAMDITGSFRQLYTIGLGMENIYGKWTNFKFYTNGTDSFAVAMNDEFIRNEDGGIWFKAARDACDDPWQVSSASTEKVQSIKMGFGWSGKDSTFWIDNIKVGTYSQMETDSWAITEIAPENGVLTFGETNNVDITIVEKQHVENGSLYVGLYKDGTLISLKKAEELTFDGIGVYHGRAAIDVPQQGGDYVLRGFVWNDEQKPLGSAFAQKAMVESAFVVPNVFSDNMMLQADQPITVWGKAFAGETVTAVLKDEQTGATATANAVAADGEFAMELPAKQAGGQYTLTLTSGMETKTYSNIIFGDVYLLAGQSNMEYWMSGLNDTKEDLEAHPDRANNPNIRSVDLLSKGTDGANAPQEDLPEVSGSMWKPMTYGNAQSASQIGYYFAQALNEDTGRPIGFISTAVGGTGSDRWVTGGSLYNNRVYPIRNLKISGILYYQGEADGEYGKKAPEYSDIMAGIIDDYRALFGNDELPFYYAQLARFGNQNFEQIRAAQFWAVDKVANKNNVGIVSNLDVFGSYGSGSNTSGNARHDIHPFGKAEVARRFTLLAKRDIYGEDVQATGPVYRSMEAKGNSLELTFDCTGDLKIMQKSQYGDYRTDALISGGQLNATILNEFEVAGSDGVYKKATAEIQGNKVILTSTQVPNPVKARYAWGAYPEAPNLTDDTGLPTYTFVTDYTTR